MIWGHQDDYKKYSLQHSVLVCVWTMYSFMFWKPYFGKIITSDIKYSSHFQRQKQYMKILVENLVNTEALQTFILEKYVK